MKKAYILLSICIVFACKNTTENKEVSEISSTINNENKIRQLDGLLGVWSTTSENSYSRETWKFENQNAYSGHSYTTVANDTVFEEYMLIRQQGKDVILTVTAVNQNDDKPVDFILIPSAPGQFTFENKNHDFPQQITYTNPTKDSIHAWVEGVIEGNQEKMDFYFARSDD